METSWQDDGHARAENDPDDPGGVTKYGIDRASHPGVDIDGLDLQSAINIYEQELKSHRFFLFPSSYGFCVYECGVNMGYITAIKMFQQAIGVEQDGIIGPVTLGHASKFDTFVLRNRFHQIRIERYRTLTAKNPKLGKFLHGWINRADFSYRIAENLERYD